MGGTPAGWGANSGAPADTWGQSSVQSPNYNSGDSYERGGGGFAGRPQAPVPQRPRHMQVHQQHQMQQQQPGGPSVPGVSQSPPAVVLQYTAQDVMELELEDVENSRLYMLVLDLLDPEKVRIT